MAKPSQHYVICLTLGLISRIASGRIGKIIKFWVAGLPCIFLILPDLAHPVFFNEKKQLSVYELVKFIFLRLSRSLLFAPRIFESDDAVEDGFFRGKVHGIGEEISLPLELKPLARDGRFERRL